MKKIIELTNKYLIIATPLLLFMFFLSIYFLTAMKSTQLIRVTLSLLLAILMLNVFISGWCNMVKSASVDKNPNEPILIIKDFTSGVGEFFLPSLGLMTIIILINIAVLTLTYLVGMHFIGDIGISPDAFTNAMANSETLKAFLTSLSDTQLLKLNMWNILTITTMSSIFFLLMFCYPALYFDTKNPCKALFRSFKNIFSKKFINIVGIFLLIFSVNFLISIFSAVFSGNPILSFLITLFNFYFICCVAVGLFYFYRKNFVDSRLGNTIDMYI